MWEPLREKFGRVVTADMAGFGFSDKPVSKVYSWKWLSVLYQLMWSIIWPIHSICNQLSLLGELPNFQTETNYTVKLQADMFENLLNSLNVKEVNILAHDLGLTVALELLARQVNVKKLHEEQGAANCSDLYLYIISKWTQIRREKAKKVKAWRSGYNQHLFNQWRYKSSIQVQTAYHQQLLVLASVNA